VTDFLYPHVRAECNKHAPYEVFLGFWERLGWRVSYERGRSFSSPPRYVNDVLQPNGGYRWPYPAFS